MSDPRRRKTRHILTPEKLSSAIQVTNLPADWTQDTVSSVVAGSGPIVDISTKTDPRTGKLSTVTFGYKSSKDCKRAFEILNRIVNLPCTLETIIPANYKDNSIATKEELALNRDSFPWNCNLDLPFEMVSEVPLPRKPTQTSNTNASNNNSVVFPDILSKASQHLPQLQPDVLFASDNVSTNLSKIPPLQLIEIISNLKILANQDGAKRSQLENFLKTNMDISVSVTQALLEMGFINYNVVTQVMKKQTRGNGFMNSVSNNDNSNNNSSVNSNSNTPLNQNTAPLNNMPMPMSMAPPFVPSLPQPQLQRPPFGFVPPPMPFMPPTPTMNMPPTIVQPQTGGINMIKLQALPQNQREMILQVLRLTDDQISVLPVDQKSMVANLRKEYIL